VAATALLGKLHPTASLRGQSLIIITRSGGSGNAAKRDEVASRVLGRRARILIDVIEAP